MPAADLLLRRLHDARPGAQRPRQLRADDVGADRQQRRRHRRPALVFIAVFTVDPVDPASLSDRRHRPARRRRHARRRAAGAGPHPRAAAHRVPLPPALRLPRPRAGQGAATSPSGRCCSCWSTSSPTPSSSTWPPAPAARRRTGGTASGSSPTASAYLIFILPHSIITVSVVTGAAAADEPGGGRRAGSTPSATTCPPGWRLTASARCSSPRRYVALGPATSPGCCSTRNVDAEDARYIGTVPAAFALGLPAFSAQYVALRGFYAQEDTRTPFLLQVVIAAHERRARAARLRRAAAAVADGRPGAGLRRSPTSSGWPLSTAVLRRRLGGLDGHRVMRTVVRLVVAARARRRSRPGASPGWSPTGSATALRGSAVALAAGGARAAGRVPHDRPGCCASPSSTRCRPTVRAPAAALRPRSASRRRSNADLIHTGTLPSHALPARLRRRLAAARRRGGIVLGWLTSIVVVFGVAGLALFDAHLDRHHGHRPSPTRAPTRRARPPRCGRRPRTCRRPTTRRSSRPPRQNPAERRRHEDFTRRRRRHACTSRSPATATTLVVFRIGADQGLGRTSCGMRSGHERRLTAALAPTAAGARRGVRPASCPSRLRRTGRLTRPIAATAGADPSRGVACAAERRRAGHPARRPLPARGAARPGGRARRYWRAHDELLDRAVGVCLLPATTGAPAVS